MWTRHLTFSLAAVMAATLSAGTAEADHRRKFRNAPAYDRYYAGPRFIQEVPGVRLFFGDYGLTEEEFDRLYGTRGEFDEGYYEPEVVTPRKSHKKVKKTASKPAPTGEKPDQAAPDAEEADPKKSATSTATDSTTKQKAASPAVNCGKAESIITGYGFSGVKPQSCTGKVYAFNATRGGRNFAIKLDPATGELTEVKKLN
jgi:hypothetical protein